MINMHIWAKTDRHVVRGSEHAGRTFPLLLHMIDVAIIATVMSEQWGIAYDDSDGVFRRLSVFLAGAHDIGKAIPQFQRLDEESYMRLRSDYDFYEGALHKPFGTGPYVPHGHATFVTLQLFLRDYFNINAVHARWLSRAVAGHHGTFPSLLDVKNLNPRKSLYMGMKPIWQQTRDALLKDLADALQIHDVTLDDTVMTHANMVKLAGLTTVSDWVASQATDMAWQSSFVDVPTYVYHMRQRAVTICERIDWSRAPVGAVTLSDVLQGREPRPLHRVVHGVVAHMPARLVLVEAPTGEGKTEASFIVAAAHAQRTGQFGTFFALPTQATSNQMYQRVSSWLQAIDGQQGMAHLVHSGNIFSSAYLQALHHATQIYDMDVLDNGTNGVQAESWFTTTKRIILAAHGVGTVDQALLGVLQTKHGYVRLVGLAGKVIVIDEVHAYDVYTSNILENLLTWLKALGCTVVLLSATLPVSRRRALLAAWGVIHEEDVAYPRVVSVSDADDVIQHTVASTQQGRRVQMVTVSADCTDIARSACVHTQQGGIALVICNTVARAQAVYQAVIQQDAHVHVVLLHSRMTNGQRAHIESRVVQAMGRDGARPARMIVIGTQVLEQSLDIDADVLITDLAPIDLLIQRVGRLHRHERPARPTSLCIPTVYIATPTPDFSNKAWFGDVGVVYESAVLLRSYLWVSDHQCIAIPDDVDEAINAVYERRIRHAVYEVYLHQADEQFDAMVDAKTWKSNVHLLGRPDQGGELFDGTHMVTSDDENATHALRPRTRDGMMSIAVLCVERRDDRLWIGETEIQVSQAPTLQQLKDYYMPAMLKVSAMTLIRRIRQTCALPKAWQRHAGLRDVYVLIVDHNHETNVEGVCYSHELGLYVPKMMIEEDV